MARYGWITNVERCIYFDGAAGEGMQVYNLNLVRPWSDAEKPGDLRAPPLSGADALLGDLLYPWRWLSPRWTVWGYLPSGTTADPTPRWESVGATFFFGTEKVGGSAAADALVARIHTGIRTELAEQTAACTYPFSRAIDDYWGRTKDSASVTARSHVHAMAPLTHWPCVASGPLLGLTGFLRVAETALEGMTHVVCFPEFDLSSADPDTPDPVKIASKPGMPPQPVTGKCFEAVCGYNRSDISFIGLAAKIVTPVTAPVAMALDSSQGLVSKGALQSAVIGHLLPLRLLSNCVAAMVDGRSESGTPSPLNELTLWAAMRDALWKGIGTGAERNPQLSKPTNLIEWLVPQEQPAMPAKLRAAAEASKPIAMALERSIDKTAGWAAALGDRPASPEWSAESAGRWSTFASLWRSASAAGTAPTTENWRDWLVLATTLLSENGARELLGPWLSFVHDAALSADPDVAVQTTWAKVRTDLRTLDAIRGDHVTRSQAALITDSQWLAISAVPDAPGVRIDAGKMVDASMLSIRNLLGDPAYALVAPTLQPIVVGRVDALIRALGEAGNRSRPRPRDRGIRLSFSGLETGLDAAALADWDNRIRGYAIALCAGLVDGGIWKPDTNRAAWVTDTALQVNLDPTTKTIAWLPAQGGRPLWMHDTVGSTSSEGERVVSVEYEGIPLATGLANAVTGILYDKGEDVVDDGFRVIDFGWPDALGQLPLLAYGGNYRAIATAIDNAGGVMAAECRADAVAGSASDYLERIAMLKPARHLANFQPSPEVENAFRYFASEPVGSPRVIVDVAPSMCELSEETKSHVYQASTKTQAAQPIVPVALLGLDTASTLLSSVKKVCRISVAPPQTHRDFFKRWTDGDRLVFATSTSARPSDPNFISDAQVLEFQSRVCAPHAPPPYHPSVTAIGFEVVDPLAPKYSALRIAAFDRTRVEGGKLVANPVRFDVEVSSVLAGAATEVGLVVGNLLPVKVPQGRFVRIRCFSLVDKAHFDALGSAGRFMPGIELHGSDDPGFEALGFRAFGPTEHWFEVMPAWVDDVLKQDAVALGFDGPHSKDGSDLSPNLATVDVSFDAAPWAAWTKGLLLQRHEWHWTGYPVALPASGAIGEWLASLAGVESFREVIDVPLVTSFDASGNWKLGPDRRNAALVYRWSLSTGTRPARFAAFFARPVLRFRRWLDPRAALGPLQLERQIYAASGVVPGRRPDNPNQRISAPPLRWSMPLTASYSPEGEVRKANGALLVFDEAIRRTDDLASVGGIGDTLEIDLVDTRFPGTSEIGANPIFHGVGTLEPATLRIRSERPFGLTFDIGPNPKVAQTALIVTPMNTGGRWVMAKLRARRLVLPESEMASRLSGMRWIASTPDMERNELERALARIDASLRDSLVAVNPEAVPIPIRMQGEDAVPLDLAIDLGPINSTKPMSLALLVESGDSAKRLDIETPRWPSNVQRPLRLLLSWHRARWNQSDEPSWRCQVLLQSQATGAMAWDTEDKASCFVNAGSQLPSRLASGRAWLFTSVAAAATRTVYRVRISDYTEPEWMIFIGSFGQPSLGIGTDYELTYSDADRQQLLLRSLRSARKLPVLRSLDLGSSESTFHLALLFRPVADVTRAASEAGTGALVGVYMAAGGGVFEHLPLYGLPASQLPPDPSGCHAQIIAVQRATALSAKERSRLTRQATPAKTDGYSCFQELLDLAFPSQESGVQECLLRFLPEYLGPVATRAPN